MVHICPRCNYHTNNKTDIKRHFERKNKCQPKYQNIPIHECLIMLSEDKLKKNKVVKHICVCGKTFDRKCRLENHQKKCKVRSGVEYQKEIEILDRKIELEKLKLKERENNEKQERLKMLNDKQKIISTQLELKQNQKQFVPSSDSQFVYLLQEREFIKTKEPIYKIGKTINPKCRISDYPRGSRVYYLMCCKNCDELEKEIITKFKNEFVHRPDIGNEYFEGEITKLSKTFVETFIVYQNFD